MNIYCVYSVRSNRPIRLFTSRLKMMRFYRKYRLFHDCNYVSIPINHVTVTSFIV